jgi:hypothetical protein
MYRPLDYSLKEFRLLVIQPGETNSRIEAECTTWIHPSAAQYGVSRFDPFFAPTYQALSYEWGDPNGKPQTILLNGQPFEIRENLHQALQCMRPHISGVPMWIDAICINQTDTNEKNHQVRMMSVIYEQASIVRVWLGACTVSDEEAFVLIQKIAHANMRIWPQKSTWTLGDSTRLLKLKTYLYTRATESEHHGGGRYMSVLDDLDPNQGERTFLPLTDNIIATVERITFFQHWAPKGRCLEGWNHERCDLEGWRALATIFERSYWSRIWIVQEYLLAHRITFHMGNAWIVDKLLTMVLESIDGIASGGIDIPPEPIRCVERIKTSDSKRLYDMHKKRKTPGSSGLLTLVDLMEVTRHSKCQDPHDKIYAILALSKDFATFRSILIDYNRSPFKVKMDVAWAVYQRGGRQFDDAYLSRIIFLLCEAFAGSPDDPD